MQKRLIQHNRLDPVGWAVEYTDSIAIIYNH